MYHDIKKAGADRPGGLSFPRDRMLMMSRNLVGRESALWNYLLPEQREIVEDCQKLIEDAHRHPKELSDYAYVVFPLAKVYEGFLKKFLLDSGLIDERQYGSDHFRIGKVLNPNLPGHMRLEGLYDKICAQVGNRDLADRFWQTWKRGRNVLFHYFPSNLQRISLSEAQIIAAEIVATMESALLVCELASSHTAGS